MESINVEILLEKYFNADISVQEEIQLKEYFQKVVIAEHLEKYRPMFDYYVQSKAEIFPKDLNLKNNKYKWKWFSIAASIVVVLSVYNGHKYLESKKAKIAFQETQDVFKLLSSNLNKGTDAVMYLEEYETTTNKIFK